MRLQSIVLLVVIATVVTAQGSGQPDVTVTAAQFDPSGPSIILTFSEEVNTSSINCDYPHFVLQNSLDNPTVNYTIHYIEECYHPTPAMNIVRFRTSYYALEDLTNEYYYEYFFESDDNPALQWSGLSTSTVLNIPPGVLPVTFIPDNVSPTVTHFELDMNTGSFCIFFDSPVNFRSVNDTPIYFTNGRGNVQALPLLRQYLIERMTCEYLTLDNLTILQTNQICIDSASCFIFFSEDFISDPFSNPVIAIADVSRLQVALFTADISIPVLRAAVLDLGGGVLILHFDSTVNASSLNPEEISFSDGVDFNTPFTLTSGSVISENGIVIELQLSEDDLNQLRNHPAICKSDASCFMSFPQDMIKDFFGNCVLFVPPNSPKLVQMGSSGNVYILAMSFNHNDQPSLSITFSSVVDDESINCNQQVFVYQNSLIDPTSMVIPVYSRECYTYDSDTIAFVPDLQDYFRILNASDLFRSANTSVLRWSDKLGLTVNITAGIYAVDEVIQDTYGPYLYDFDLDLNQNTLTLLFDSVVDFASLNLNELTLQNKYSSPNATFTLTGGSVIGTGGSTVCIQLSLEDVMSLKNLQYLCEDRELCYINVTSDMISDIWGNNLYPSPVQVSRLTTEVDGFLKIRLLYVGCYTEVSLAPSEGLIPRSYLGEKIISVRCAAEDGVNQPELSWKNGTIANVTSPLTGQSISSQSLPYGLSSHNYGVFVCTRPDGSGYTQNFILDSHSFVESPNGYTAYVPLYSPLRYRIHFGPDYWSTFSTGSIELRNGSSQIMARVYISEYEAIVVANASDVLYSVSGNYAAVFEEYGSYDNITFTFNITVTDPTVQASDNEVVVVNGQTALELSCIPSSPELPVVWREGQRSLSTSDTSGVLLTPAGLNHKLTFDLNTYSLTGDDIVCEIVDPEGNRGVVASDKIEVTLSTDGPTLEECESEVDTEWKIRWDSTFEGATNEQECPRFSENQDIVGSAQRKCLEDGVWGEVDVTNCANAAFSDLEKQVEDGLNNEDPAEREMFLAGFLPALADAVTPNETAYIFPQDLIKSNDIVESVISQLIEDVEENVSSTLQTGVVIVLDKLLSEEHTDNWERVTSINNKSDGSLLLQNAENYAEYVVLVILSESVDTDDNVTLTEDNIQLSAEKLDKTDYSDVVYSAEDDGRAKIIIPSMYLSSRCALAVVNMRLENIENILPVDDGSVAGAPVIFSHVIAEKNSSNDTVPVRLTFVTFPISNAQNPRCVFWDSTQRKWVTDGIEVVAVEDLESDSYKVTCESYHLASFSVIVDIVEEETESDVYEFTTAGYVGAGAMAGGSFLSSLIFVISFIACIGRLKSLNVFHFAYLGLFISMMCSGVILLSGLSEATDHTAACTAVAGLLQYFFTAAFTWALVIGFLGLVAVAARNPVTFSWKWCIVLFIFGFGVPAIPTAISVGMLHDDYGNDGFCWIQVEEDEYSNSVLWANAAPMAAIAVVTLLIAVIALLFSCIRTIQKTSNFKVCGLLFIETSAVLLSVLVGGCWVCGLLMVNDIWDPAEWVFMACSIALGVAGLVGSMLLICGNDMMCNLFSATPNTSEKNENRYWNTNKPMVTEAGQMQSTYAMKGTVPKSDSAYAMMGVASDTSVEAMMDGSQQETKLEETTTGTS